MSIRVAVITADHDVCCCLLDAIHRQPAYVGVGFRNHPAARVALRSAAPDVVVIDRATPDALALCAELSRLRTPGVILVRVPDDGVTAIEALSAGARGVVYETQPIQDVARAVDVVHRGLIFAPRHVVAAAWMRLRADAAPPAREHEAGFASLLSTREREVFRHAAVGLCNKELATRLSISEATVKVHLSHIFQKLGLRGRCELAAAYYGIIR